MSFSAWLSSAAQDKMLFREGMREIRKWDADAGQLHRAAIGRGLLPTVPCGVLAEAWCDGPQRQLSRLLKGCKVEELSEEQARQVGGLIARSGLDDTVDVAVAEGGLRRNDAVVMSDRTHIAQVADAAGKRIAMHDV